jgi:hypothetical protein
LSHFLWVAQQDKQLGLVSNIPLFLYLSCQQHRLAPIWFNSLLPLGSSSVLAQHWFQRLRQQHQSPQQLLILPSGLYAHSPVASASKSKKSCATIVLDNIAVPSGTTLDLTELNSGTHVSLKGAIYKNSASIKSAKKL